MTWKKIIDTNNQEEFIKKADSQEYVYLLFDSEPPYMIIDLAYSLYEIAKKYKIRPETIQKQFTKRLASQKGHFVIEKVYTGLLTSDDI